MRKNDAPIICWFLFLINFSVEKLFVYFVVECLDCEIKDCSACNFIVIYKGKGEF